MQRRDVALLFLDHGLDAGDLVLSRGCAGAGCAATLAATAAATVEGGVRCILQTLDLFGALACSLAQLGNLVTRGLGFLLIRL